MRVFATKGYHTSRVGDIAKEAGVAHGLLYHYFSSKEEVLHTVFRDNWTRLVVAFEAIDEGDEPPRKQLEAIAKILLRTWRYGPDLVRVMIREVARSPQLQTQVEEIRGAFVVIQRVIERGQADGSFRAELRPAARDLDLLRWPRGVAHRVGDGSAARRRRGGGACRANPHRHRPRRSRRQLRASG